MENGCSVYIAWGEQCLGDISAQFEGGETETFVDNAYAEMVYDFPRMQQLTAIAFLRNKICRLSHEQHLPFPQRPPRFGSANAKKCKNIALEIPSLFAQQTLWLEGLRKVKFDIFA